MMTDRIAFNLLTRPIYWYGVMVAVGFLAGMLIMQWRASRAGIAANRVSDLAMAAIVGGLVGARLFYVLLNFRDYSAAPMEILRIDRGGLVYYGGFIGAALAIYWLSRRLALDTGRVADLAAVGLPLGQAIGRLGCFLNGCCFGKVSELPWSVIYPYAPSDASSHLQVWLTQKEAGLLTVEAAAARFLPESGFYQCLPVHPVQLYQAILNLAIFGLLLAAAPRVKPPGRLLALYMISYGICRGLIEFLRGDYLLAAAPGRASDYHFGLTNSQLISIALVAGGIWLFRRLGRRTASKEATR